MTVSEFNPIMTMLIHGCQPKTPPTKECNAVYFDLLNDLDAVLVMAAAKQALLNHEYPNLPPVGLIRKLAISLRSPTITGPEAWGLILTAVRNYSPDLDGSEQRQLAKIPARVAYAVKCFGGLGVVVNSTLCQNQFLERWDRLEEKHDDRALMPPAVAAIAESIASEFTLDAPKHEPLRIAQ